LLKQPLELVSQTALLPKSAFPFLPSHNHLQTVRLCQTQDEAEFNVLPLGDTQHRDDPNKSVKKPKKSALPVGDPVSRNQYKVGTSPKAEAKSPATKTQRIIATRTRANLH